MRLDNSAKFRVLVGGAEDPRAGEMPHQYPWGGDVGECGHLYLPGSASLMLSFMFSLTDVSIPNWSFGCPAALDIHVISPFQQQILAEASVTPCHVLQV